METKTFPQGSLLWPVEPFIAKIDRSTISAFPGQSFWVTNSQLDQSKTGIVRIARSGKGAGSAHPFSILDAIRFFRRYT